MLAFIYDCTARQRENGVQKNDCMMGIPTETTRDKGRDRKSLSQLAKCIWYAATCPLLFNEELLEQKQQQIPILLRQKRGGCSCWLYLIKVLSCQGQAQPYGSRCLFCLTVHMQSTVTVMDIRSMCAEHKKGRMNSTEVLVTTLLLLCTFALYMTLQ